MEFPFYEDDFEYCASIIEKDFSQFDFDQESEKITVYTPKGILLINWHGVAKEIWVSSPVSGAHHFFFHEGIWVNTRTKTKFKEQIKEELSILK
jgi:CyaY protein